MIKTKIVVSGERSASMRNNVFSGVTAFCLRGACRSLASLLLAFSAMAFLFTGPISVAQDSKTPAVLPAPSSGKAIVCIYRTYRFTGSSSHDELYVNGTHLAKTPQQRIRIHGSAAGYSCDLRIAQGVLRKHHHVRRGGRQSSQAERKRAGPV